MKAKLKEKEICRNLRQQGYSLNYISKKVGVAKSSVSAWVRDIELTNEQIKKIEYQRQASTSNSETYRKRRREYQENGREKAVALKSDPLYAFGCALYWGEGRKNRGSVRLTNSDPQMLSFFVKFLKKYFNVSNDCFTISIQYYLNNGLKLNDIEEYWCNILDLDKRALRGHTLKSKYYSNSKVKHPYGICSVGISSTEIAMNIYGSIKEYICDNSEDKWIW